MITYFSTEAKVGDAQGYAASVHSLHSAPGHLVSAWNSISRIVRLNAVFKILFMYGVLMKNHFKCGVFHFFEIALCSWNI